MVDTNCSYIAESIFCQDAKSTQNASSPQLHGLFVLIEDICSPKVK